MSSRTSSLSTLTTVPSTIWPSSTSTIDGGDGVVEAAVEVVGGDLAGHVLVSVRGARSSGGAMVAVWSDKGKLFSGTEWRDRMPARGLRAHKAVRGYQARPEQDVAAPRRAAPRARGRAAARRSRRGRPTRGARPRARPAGASRRSSRGVKQVVQRSTSASRPSSSLISVRSWCTPGAGVEGRRAPPGSAPGSRTRRR